MAGRKKTSSLLDLMTPDPGGAYAGPSPYEQQFAPPSMPATQFNLETPETGAMPRASGGVTLPGRGYELELRGDYLRNPQGAPADWSLGLGLRRRF